MNTTSLAGEAIPFSGFVGLPLPIGSIVGIKPAPPNRIIFSGHIDSMSFKKTCSVTIIVSTFIDLVLFQLQFFSASGTIYNHSGIRNSHYSVFLLPCPGAFSATKIMLTNSTRGYFFSFTAIITGDDGRGKLTFFTAIVNLIPFGMPRCAFKFFATSSTFYSNLVLLSQARTFKRTIQPVFSPIRGQILNLAALFTDNFNTLFRWSGKFLGGKFAPAFIGTGQPSIMPQPGFTNAISASTDRTSFFNVHTHIINHRCNLCNIARQVIVSLLAGWDEVIGIEQSPEYWQISQARLAWWADWLTWGQTDVDTILAAAGEEAKETTAGQLGLF